MTSTKKRIGTILICLCMLVGLFPTSAYATGEEHTHSWSSGWTASDTHHWHDCTAGGCTITSESECSGYGAHDFGTYPYRCTVCEFSPGHEHYGGTATCEYQARCEGCGASYGDTNPDNHQIPEGFGEMIDESSHKIMCSCGHVFVASEPHNFTPWDTNSDGTEERWCGDCFYAETRSPQHSHSYSKANCVAPATCSCGSTTGEKDPSNHTGGTEIKNAIDATYDAEGYTGDTYCKGCGAKIATGTTIAKLSAVDVKIDEDAGVESVTFQPSEGISIPDDASLVVKQQKVGLDSILSLFETDLTISDYHFDSSVIDDAIYIHTDGTEYRSGEVVRIDGQKYLIGEYSGDGSVLPVINLADGMMREYNMAKLQFEETDGIQTDYKQTERDVIRIDGILYEVPYSYTDSEGFLTKVLYYEGKPAGMIDDANVSLYSDLTPSNVQAAGSRYLGTVTPNTARGGFNLSIGTTYDAYLIGASSLQLLSGAGDPLFTASDSSNEKIGTVSQIYASNSLLLAPSLFSDPGTQYVAIHFSRDDLMNSIMSDLDFGEVSPSSDGTQLEATFDINHFSPFVVYAFVEAQESEIKVITSSTSSISDVGNTDDSGVDDSNTTIPDDSRNWNWPVVAGVALVLAAAIMVFCLRKRNISKDSGKNSQN